MRRIPLAAAVAAAVFVAACGADDEGTAGAADRLLVATTVAPITSIVAGIGGDRVEIEGVVPEGTNSHTFEPVPSDAELLSRADVVFINGLQLEEPTRRLAEENTHDAVEIVQLGDLAIDEEEHLYDFSFPREGGKPNPHLWTSPPLVVRYAEIVAEVLSELDPGGAPTFEANLDRYAAKVDELDAAMRTAFETVPPGRRKLLTYHDAYAYFARSYGWEVIGAIQVSSFDDPTPREIGELIAQVRDEGIPAIFGSEIFPSPVLDQIAAEAGVSYHDDLLDDDLPGEPGDDDHGLLSLLRFNYRTITEALGGDPSALDALDLSTGVPDEARYPR